MMNKIMAIVCAIIMMACNVIATCAHAEGKRVHSYGEIDNMNMTMMVDIAKKYETKIQIIRDENEELWAELYTVTVYEVHCDRWYTYTISFVNDKYTGATEVSKTLAIHDFENAV